MPKHTIKRLKSTLRRRKMYYRIYDAAKRFVAVYDRLKDAKKRIEKEELK